MPRADPRSPVAALLVASARGDGFDERWTGLPGDAVLVAAAHHRIRPAVHRLMRHAGVTPPVWHTPLAAARAHQLKAQMQAAHDLTALSSAARGCGARWAVAKGPVLTDTVWPFADMREFTDLDVFVHPDDFADVLTALEQDGFSLVDRNWPEIDRLGRAELALRGPSGFPLDLHWDLSGAPRAHQSFSPDLARMLSSATEVTLGTGITVPTFAPTELLFHILLHGAQSGANRLVWIADAHHAARRRDVDWDALEELGRRSASLTAISVVLARVERAFGTDLPLAPAMRRSARSSLAGRVARAREKRRPFPAQPGGRSMSGTEYSSARDSVSRTVAAMVHESWEIRRIEARRRGEDHEPNPLDQDVPDAEARRRYLDDVVRRAASPGPP